MVDSSPWLFAVAHVLLRLQAPRHPPLALCSLENKDARARFGILKGLHSARRGQDSVTALRRISQNGKQPEQTARPGHARGERSPPARVRPGHEGRKGPGPEELPKGSTRYQALPHPGLRRAPKGHHRERPEWVTPSKRNSESSERFRRDRTVNDGLRRSRARCKQLPQGCQRRPSICRYTRAPE